MAASAEEHASRAAGSVRVPCVQEEESVPTILQNLGDLRMQAEAVLRSRETGMGPAAAAAAAAAAAVVQREAPREAQREAPMAAVVATGSSYGEEGERRRRPSDERREEERLREEEKLRGEEQRRREEERQREEEKRKEQAEQAARELAARERNLAEREQRLADREADAYTGLRAREQQLLERERQLSERERQSSEREERWRDQERKESQEIAERQAELANRWKECSDRQEQWRTQQLAENEEMKARAEGVAEFDRRLRAEEADAARRTKEQEERLSDLRQQLQERDLRWAEACKDVHVLKQHLPKTRFSPRGNKENQELLRQLEEQQGRMHEIKRKPTSWGQGGSPSESGMLATPARSSEGGRSSLDSQAGESLEDPSNTSINSSA